MPQTSDLQREQVNVTQLERKQQRDRMGALGDSRKPTEQERQLMKANRALADERNEVAQQRGELARLLADYETVIAVLTARLGGDVFITKREAARMFGQVYAQRTKAGTRIRVSGNKKSGV